MNTAAELFEKISEIWASFTVEYIKSWYVSTLKRVRQVQQARGYITKY
jgi:hypothetical protein